MASDEREGSLQEVHSSARASSRAHSVRTLPAWRMNIRGQWVAHILTLSVQQGAGYDSCTTGGARLKHESLRSESVCPAGLHKAAMAAEERSIPGAALNLKASGLEALLAQHRLHSSFGTSQLVAASVFSSYASNCMDFKCLRATCLLQWGSDNSKQRHTAFTAFSAVATPGAARAHRRK